MSLSHTKPIYVDAQDQMYDVCEQMSEYEIKAAEGKDDTLAMDFFLDSNTASGQKYIATLNQNCKIVVELGIGIGEQVKSLRNKKWDIIGYERSPTAISYMKLKRPYIKIREAELKSEKTYLTSLETDLSKPTNIIIANVLEHMLDIDTQKPTGVASLLFHCIRLSKPGTVFFITSHCFQVTLSNKEDDQPEKKLLEAKLSKTRLIQAGYVPSFFAARTDFQILHDDHVKYYPDSEKKRFGTTLSEINHFEIFSEIFMVKKL